MIFDDFNYDLYNKYILVDPTRDPEDEDSEIERRLGPQVNKPQGIQATANTKKTNDKQNLENK